MQSLLSWCLQSKSRNRHANKFTIQYSKVLPWRYLQNAVGTWKREEHLPGEIRNSFREEVATELRLDQQPRSCHGDRQAEGRTGAKTQRPKGHCKGLSNAVFLALKGRWGEWQVEPDRRSQTDGRISDHEEPFDHSSIYSTNIY